MLYNFETFFIVGYNKIIPGSLGISVYADLGLSH
jgi:hypothetical protein